MQNSVDLILNCYEKTYQKLLNKELINSIKNSHNFNFTNIFVVISNVDNKQNIKTLAQPLKESGTIDGYYFVDEHLDTALSKVGLSLEKLGSIYYYSTWAFVALEIAQSDYILHHDTDVIVDTQDNWIEKSINLMKQNSNYLIATLPWTKDKKEEQSQSCKSDSEFFIGYGFSDQLYLANKNRLYDKIYNHKHIYSLRYPMSYLGKIYEMRIDSYMRRFKLYRIVYKNGYYHHPATNEISSYPKGSFLEYNFKRLFFWRISQLYKKVFGEC